ncbi:FGGY-family carbohydrate kinase [Palleronia sp. LCG004]|uniref:FGGY-family carbohydrate kinase n=1 Tax=Palleronia sp. LCG004 TaxID=3079304 RepID=UPI002942F8AA|nr:FGGY family carbohydrate kinase [Palleronia sp. LCG004]WOI56289.1 FGGY family carbohydrate kinase [Palleronia sp. LCG004]
MTKLRLALDIGTTAIKAAAFTPDGACMATMQRASATITAPGGRSEQDMEGVWRTVCAVLQGLARQLDPSEIGSLGICAQGDGFWAVDADGQPLGNAILWNDTRAAADVTALERSGASDAVGRASHTSLWPGTSGALWRWLRRAEPERAARVAHVFTCGDWIGYRLTGVAATDRANGSIPFLDLSTGRYSREALAALDCEDLGELLSRPQPADTRLGTILPGMAEATGLPAGLPVATPTLDLAAMILGMGMERPGETMMIMGTTAVVNILTDSVVPESQPAGASALHPTSDAIIRILAPSTGASAFDWFAGLHPTSLGGEDAGAIAAKLDTLVTDVPPGANGVTFLPYLSGERAPFVSPDIAAAFHGLTGRSSKADMARAVMEGTAMSLRHCFVSEGGLPDKPVQLTGGGARNGTWCQIIADILGVPVVTSEGFDQGLWGAATLGAAAAGEGRAIDLVMREDRTRQFDPDPARHEAYDRVFDRYAILSNAARRTAEELRALTADDHSSEDKT